MESYDVAVLGGGPAGLAAALSSHGRGASTILIERENRLGGILKQCIHDGFGLIRFREKLTGPEYAGRYIRMIQKEQVPFYVSTFLIGIRKDYETFILTLVNEERGVFEIRSRSLVLACGCRERTARQVSIHGTRPAGIYTAGTAQYFVNIAGCLPCKKCVILGSGDIGLIMARRLTLEGAQVLGVYEAKPAPSGLSRNISQCLEDYSIPLYLSHTITSLFGDRRIEGVEISRVDEAMNPIPGTEKRVACDGVIVSVGLIPENEIAESLGIRIDPSTNGPYVDQNFMTSMEGAFACGNALHVNDMVDYVSESGALAGESAAVWSISDGRRPGRKLVGIAVQKERLLYSVPQYIDLQAGIRKVTVYFRSRQITENVRIQIKYRGNILFTKKYHSLKPPEMERIELELPAEGFLSTDFEETGNAAADIAASGFREADIIEMSMLEEERNENDLYCLPERMQIGSGVG